MMEYLLLVIIFLPFQLWYCSRFLDILFSLKFSIFIPITTDTFFGFLTTVGYNLFIGCQPIYPSLIMYCVLILVYKIKIMRENI